MLRVSITGDDEGNVERLKRHYVRGFGSCQTIVAEPEGIAFQGDKLWICDQQSNMFVMQ